MSELNAVIEQWVQLWHEAEQTSLLQAASRAGLAVSRSDHRWIQQNTPWAERHESTTQRLWHTEVPELFSLDEAQATAHHHRHLWEYALESVTRQLGTPHSQITLSGWWEEQEPLYQSISEWRGEFYSLQLIYSVSGLEQLVSLSLTITTSALKESP